MFCLLGKIHKFFTFATGGCVFLGGYWGKLEKRKKGDVENKLGFEHQTASQSLPVTTTFAVRITRCAFR